MFFDARRTIELQSLTGGDTVNGKLIKETRKQLGITLEQLADAAECSVRTLQRYESENFSDDSKFYTLIRICNALNLPIQSVLLDDSAELVRTRRTEEKSIEEIAQILQTTNFGELQYYYHLARFNCIADTDYYFIYSVAGRYSTQLKWVGFDEYKNDIWAPREVIPQKMILLCSQLYGDPIIINDESDVFLFRIFGGYALVKKPLYHAHFTSFLKNGTIN